MHSMKEEEFHDFFYSYLIKQGYPEDQILSHWRLSRGAVVDIAITDPVTKKPIALFELKGPNVRMTKEVAEQLIRYADAVGDSYIPLFAVFPSIEPPSFELYQINYEGATWQPSEQLSTFANLKNRFLSKEIISTQKDKKKTLDWFRWICWLLAMAVGFMLYLDFKGQLVLTAERLGVMAIIVALAIVPFARKLSILGLEFERLQEQAKS